ncbi:MAG: hypothetical protein AAGK66_05640 [Pseudomonadota bacterium]
MIMKSSLTVLLAFGFGVQGAFANCKTPPEKYDLVDLGDVIENQAESRAIAIDDRGRIILQTMPGGISQQASEYLIGRNGKAAPIENPDQTAIRETIRLIGDRMRLTKYTLVQEGFLPARATTLIDRKGGEIDVKDFCKVDGAADWEVKSFAISDNSDHAVALFETETGYTVATCAFEEAASVLFETTDEIELAGINNDGEIGGLLGNRGELFLWRWTDKGRVTSALPDDLLNAEVSGIDNDGRVFAMATGTVVNPAIYLTENDDLAPVTTLPGDGWDVNWITVGPCGTVFGEATYTNFAAFVQLPEEEKARLRADFAKFWQYALERESALFVWSPGDRNGKFLGSAARDTRSWSDIRITAINEDGVAIGYGDNEFGQTRAIKLVPTRD